MLKIEFVKVKHDVFLVYQWIRQLQIVSNISSQGTLTSTKYSRSYSTSQMNHLCGYCSHSIQFSVFISMFYFYLMLKIPRSLSSHYKYVGTPRK